MWSLCRDSLPPATPLIILAIRQGDAFLREAPTTPATERNWGRSELPLLRPEVELRIL